MSPTMSPATRFRWWQAVVVFLLFGQAAAIISAGIVSPPAWVVAIAIAVFEVAIAALVKLLATTPSDAIRLPVTRSQAIIVGGTCVLLVATTLLPERTAASLDVGLFIFAAAVFGVIVLARRGVSPWWIVPLVWNPLLLLIA